MKKEDAVNHAVGLKVCKKLGKVMKGELLGTLYADDESLFDEAEKTFLEAYVFGDENVPFTPIVIDRIAFEKSV